MKGIGVIAILALLQQPPTPVVPASQTEKIKDGTITVNVFDSVTHNPIVGARITFIYFQSPPPNIVTSVNSDANGQAIFRDLNEGRYGIGADKDGYVSTPTAAVTNTVELRAETRKTDVTVNLVPGALITGRVLDPDGLPVAKATVSLSRLTYRNGLPTLPPVVGSGISNTTDDRGAFRISGTAPGNYYLRVELHLIDCRTCVSWDLLPRTSYYPGVVDSRAGVPIAVSTGQNILSLDVKLPKVETYTISGTVLNPLEGGLVFAGRQSREISSYFLGSSDPDALEEPVLIAARNSKTDNPDESHFEIPSVVPGSYYLYPLFGQSSGINGYATHQTLVQVTDHDIDNLKITLTPNSTIKGKVVVAEDAGAINLSMLRITLRSRDKLPTLLGGAIQPSAVIQDPAAGTFSIDNVVDGHFSMIVAGLPGDAYVSDIQQSGQSLLPGNTFSSSVNDPLEIHIRGKGGVLQGMVRNEKGEPAAGMAVTLVPALASRRNPQLYSRTRTNTTGQFTIHGIAPGEYTVFAWSSPPAGQAEENALFLSQVESKGTLVTVGSVTNPVTLTLITPP